MLRNKKEIINKTIQGVGFGFLHDDEIKRLSVKQLTNSQTYDTMKQPVIGGLYDRAFGPTDPHDRCDTCELGELDCPGHPGHIQLAVPVYDIFLLELLIKLLNSKCWNCHHLRLSTLKKKIVYAQFLYLNAAQLLKAQEVAELVTSSLFRGRSDENQRSIEEKLDHHIQQAQQLNASATPTQSRLTFHVYRARNELMKSFLSSAKTANGKCHNCGAHSPVVRRDGFTKIFVQSLNSRQRTMNDRLGVRIHSIMSKSQYHDELIIATESPEELKRQTEEAQKKHKAKLRKYAKVSKKKRKTAEDSSDESQSDDDLFDDLETELVENDEDDGEQVFGQSTAVLNEQAKKAALSEIHENINAATDIEETTSRLMLPNEIERHMALLWSSTDSEFLSMFFAPGTRQTVASNPYNTNDYRAFFHRCLLLPPSRFRPPRYLGGEFFEASANVSYRKIFDANEEIVRTVFQKDTSTPPAPDSAEGKKLTAQTIAQANDTESRLDKLTPAQRKRVVDAWISMQHELNILYDSDKTGNHLVKSSGDTGIKQLLEKKQGLFRKHMMGKRVNFAARSVISPDPYLHTREIGVPEIFAKTLTFPEPVAAYNLQELRQAVINGPFIHPGANSVITTQGREVSLSTMTLEQRIALADQLMGNQSDNKDRLGAGVTSVEKNLKSAQIGDGQAVTVLRHLRSGDVLLVNRQPTLHKPSMMAHVARVLFGENVIRMHYANCNSYNADFDGDEMNLHFPQNQLARIEAYDIANNDNQYIVPTSGNPLRGLIQDHVVCGVRLTSRDMFLNREYFHQFLFLAIADRDVQKGNAIVTPQPTILKPRALWTGKQIINNILDFVAEGRPPLNLAPTKAKVPGISWGKQGQEDGLVVIRENRLVQGVLDKAMFGASKYGVVHAVYELYGAKAAGNLLTIFARLFTRVLQYDAFTCGIEDFLLTHNVEIQRRVAIEQSQWDGIQATSNCAGLEGNVQTFGPNKINQAVQRLYLQHKNAGEMLDNAVKAALSQNTSNIIKLCIPTGQRIPFPKNNMAMMTLTGAKGSAVNHSQIACLLGQQELEGRRVPVTMAGKTLPSFPRYDPQPRAGGYITQRFFTGIRPQEYYFHAMAGREGLVDTAVKTARSGYLQRCLIKLLEGLAVRYDNTVRDVDNSIVQFQYGEDGIDAVKAGYLSAMPFLASNFNPLMAKLNPESALEKLDSESVDETIGRYKIQQDELDQLIAAHHKLVKKEDIKLKDITDPHKRDKKMKEIAAKRAEREQSIQMNKDQIKLTSFAKDDPISSQFPIGKTLGAVSEKYRDSYHEYIKDDPDGTFANAALMNERWTERLEAKQAELKSKTSQLKSMRMSSTSSGSKYNILESQVNNLQEQINTLQSQLDNILTPEKFIVLMNLYYMNNLAHAGENVGVLAGQSVGEPSTQMTLNTFHLAGHGGANVTLGIPRLREIVMTASDHISTPIMELPLKPGSSPDAAAKLAAKLNKVKLSECLTSINVSQNITSSGARVYNIRLNLKDLTSDWASQNLVTPYNIAKCVAIELSRKLHASVHSKLRRANSGVLSSHLHRSHAELMTNAEEEPSEIALDNDELASAMDASERRKLRDLEEGADEVARINRKKQQSSYDDNESDEDGEVEAGRKSDKFGQKTSMDDIDSDDDDDDNDEESQGTDIEDKMDDDDDSDSEEPKQDKKTTKRTKAATSTKAAKANQTKLATEAELEAAMVDFATFWRRLVPYWARHSYITQIDFDPENQQFIDIAITTPQGSSKLLMLSTMESICEVCRVRYTEGINKAMVIERKSAQGKFKVVQTDGVNFQAAIRFPEIDHPNIKTNDIHKILKTYGVEAACSAIRGEISGVFAVYGIVVDPRHLSLIADFMTFQGGYHAMNRNAMGSRPSILQKATFETSMKFILDACKTGEFDHLSSPSSSIVFGKPIQTGTNTFDIRQPLPTL